MFCVIWYHLHHVKNVKNTHGGVLLLVNLQAFSKSNTPPWVFFTFLKLYKWYQIMQRITYWRQSFCKNNEKFKIEMTSVRSRILVIYENTQNIQNVKRKKN